MTLLVKWLWLLPVAIMMVSLSTISVSYLLTVVVNEDYDAWLPYLADLGNYPPASCVFTFGISITCSLLVVLAYVVFGFLSFRLDCTQVSPRVDRWVNVTSAWVGGCFVLFTILWWNILVFCIKYMLIEFSLLLSSQIKLLVASALGFLVVASFQKVNLFVVHVIGSCIAYACALSYMLCITYLLWKTGSEWWVVTGIRIIMTMIGFGCAIISLVLGEIFSLFGPSAVLEWVVVLIFIGYIASTIPIHTQCRLRTNICVKVQPTSSGREVEWEADASVTVRTYNSVNIRTK